MNYPTFEISWEAQNDLASIVAFSESRWGDSRAEAYYLGILNVIESLATHPEIGKNVGRSADGIRRFPHESHFIYYRVLTAHNVRVLRVFHVRRRIGTDAIGDLTS